MDLFSCLSPFVFCSFASGSSGNCYYVGKQDEGVIVDVGITAQQVVLGLKKNDLRIGDIKAILVTHDHIDHVKGLEVLTKNTPIPIYAHSDCLQGLIEGKATKNVDPQLFHEIEPLQPFEICGITVEAFPVMHDGRGAVGYHFNYEGHTLTIATDIGMLDKVVKEQIRRADNLVIEANYDVEMYEESARFVADAYHSGMKNIMLCHLSENNNTPERAMQCLYHQFRKKHVHPDVNTSIFPLPRHKSTGFVYL